MLDFLPEDLYRSLTKYKIINDFIQSVNKGIILNSKERTIFLENVKEFKSEFDAIHPSIVSALEYYASRKMKFVTFIPDKSLVTSRLGLLEQGLIIDYDEIQSYFEWVKERKDDEVAQKATLLTINNLKPNEALWEKSNSKGKYTLGQCIEHNMCTCFHRSIFFHLMMQSRDVDCLVLHGYCAESQTEKLHENPRTATMIYVGNLNVGDDYFSEAHLWNVIMYNNKHYLVDTAFLVDGKPVFHEIDFEVDESLRWVWTIKKSTGHYKFRHYLSVGTIQVELIR